MSNDKSQATGYTPPPYENTTTWHDDMRTHAESFPGGEYALAKPVKPKEPKPWLYPAFVGAALVVGAVCGAILTPNQTPEACKQALSYSEQGLNQSAKGLEALGGAVGGGYGEMIRAEKELNSVSQELGRLTPLYKDAKQECLK